VTSRCNRHVATTAAREKESRFALDRCESGWIANSVVSIRNLYAGIAGGGEG